MFKPRIFIIFLTSVSLWMTFASCSAAELTESNLTKCSVSPGNCAAGVKANPARRGTESVNEIEFERVSTKIVFFGTNRKVVEFSQSENNLTKISDFFSSQDADFVTYGAIEQLFYTERGVPIINNAFVYVFNDLEELPEFARINGIDFKHRKKYMYIHGVDNNVGSAVVAAAFISGMSKDGGPVPFAFLWPSKSWSLIETITGRGYDHDKTRSEQSAPELEKFINGLADLDLFGWDYFAHSRGAYVLMRYIDDVSDEILNRVKSITLAAPDIDSNGFFDIIDDLRAGIDCVLTIYFSEEDRAISFSEFKNSSRRLQNDGRVFSMERVDIINVGKRTSITGHDFHTGNRNVSNDFRTFLMDGRRASERSTVISAGGNEFVLKSP